MKIFELFAQALLRMAELCLRLFLQLALVVAKALIEALTELVKHLLRMREANVRPQPPRGNGKVIPFPKQRRTRRGKR